MDTTPKPEWTTRLADVVRQRTATVALGVATVILLACAIAGPEWSGSFVRRVAWAYLVTGLGVGGRVLFQHRHGWARQPGRIGERLRVHLRREVVIAVWFCAGCLTIQVHPRAWAVCVFGLAGGFVLRQVSSCLSASAAELRRRRGPELLTITAALHARLHYEPFATETDERARRGSAARRALAGLTSPPPVGQCSLLAALPVLLGFSAGFTTAPVAFREQAPLLAPIHRHAGSDPPAARDRTAAEIGRPAAAISPPTGTSTQPLGPSTRPATETYTGVCGPTAPDPGTPAPAPVARQLHDLWLGPAGLGARVAGCATAATRVQAHGDVWVTRGICAGTLQSVGIAGGQLPPAILLGDAAAFAVEQAEAGVLLGSSPRFRVGAGDAYVVTTTVGRYVVIRSSVSDVHRSAAVGCGAVAAYTVVPPRLARARIGVAVRSPEDVVRNAPRLLAGPGTRP